VVSDKDLSHALHPNELFRGDALLLGRGQPHALAGRDAVGDALVRNDALEVSEDQRQRHLRVRRILGQQVRPALRRLRRERAPRARHAAPLLEHLEHAGAHARLVRRVVAQHAPLPLEHQQLLLLRRRRCTRAPRLPPFSLLRGALLRGSGDSGVWLPRARVVGHDHAVEPDEPRGEAHPPPQLLHRPVPVQSPLLPLPSLLRVAQSCPRRRRRRATGRRLLSRGLLPLLGRESPHECLDCRGLLARYARPGRPRHVPLQEARVEPRLGARDPLVARPAVDAKP